MKDQDGGIYYFPFPDNKRVRMYVRKWQGDIEFRMWSPDDDQLWEEHGWVPHEAVLQATEMYSGKTFDPKQVYDIRIARAVIRDETQQDEAGNRKT